MQVGDIVTLNDTDGITGVIEVVRGDVIYVRNLYTGDTYTRVLDEVTLADPETAAMVIEDALILSPANPACKVVKTYPGGGIITQGMVDAEVAKTNQERPAASPSREWIVGVNASTNMFA